MNKLLTLLTAAILAFGSTQAQTVQQTTAATKQKATHTTKSGTPDKRYKENKMSASSAAAPTGPTKKDGTPDMRYKANKSTKMTTATKKN